MPTPQNRMALRSDAADSENILVEAAVQQQETPPLDLQNDSEPTGILGRPHMLPPPPPPPPSNPYRRYKPPHLEKFQKGMSPSLWWLKFMTFCSLVGMPNLEIIQSFPMFVTDTVSDWFLTLDNRSKTTVQVLKDAFVDRFKTITPYDIGTMNLKQKDSESVDDYFDRVIRDTVDIELAPLVLIGMVVAGLLPDIGRIVMPQDPDTIAKARRLALSAERALKHTSQDSNSRITKLEDKVASMSDNIVQEIRGLFQTSSISALNQPSQHQQPHQWQHQQPHQWQHQQPQQWQHQQPQQWQHQQPQHQHPKQWQYQQQQQNRQPRQKWQNPQQQQRPQCPGCGNIWTNLFTSVIQGYVVLSMMVTLVIGQPQIPNANANTLSRLNYGVIFQKENPMHLSREYWLHTFAVDIPKPVMSVQMPRCQHSHVSCHILNSVIVQVNDLKHRTLVHVQEVVSTILDLIPESKMFRGNRSQRSFLPFIGQLSKGLFGTATMDDVNILARHVNALIKRTQKVTKAVEQHGSHLSSYMDVVDERITNLKSGIEQNFNSINKLLHTFRFTFEHLELTLTNISGMLAEQVQKANQLEITFLSLQSSIQSLIEGKLTPFLLPKQVLAQTIIEIQGILSSKYSGFHLIVSSPAEMYKKAEFFYTRNDSTLYLTVKFPIASRTNSLHMYRIRSLPVPVNNTTQHATQLMDLPDYFAVTYHKQYYASLTSRQLMTCDLSESYLCNFNIPLTPATVSSCVWALFVNDKTQVHKHCNFRFRKSLLKSTVLEISPSSVLVYNTPKVSVNCPSNQYIIPGCSFCIHRVPCMCTLSSHTWYYAPRLIHCINNTQEQITPSYPVNLALLQEFFNESHIAAISGESTFSIPTSINIPEFKLYNHSFSKMLAADEKSHLSLRKMADATKKDQLIFETLAEPLLDGEIDINQSWLDKSTILTLVAISIASLSLIAVVLILFKLRNLSTALLVLQQVSHVKSMTPPTFNYAKPTTALPESKSISLEIFQQFSWIHASVFLNVIILILVLAILVLLCKRKRKGTILYLEITNSTDCQLIPILNLPLCPSYWDIQHPQDIADLSLDSFVSRKLHVDWPDFKITNQLTKTSILVTNAVNVSFWQYFAIKKLLKQPFCVHILISHQGIYQPLKPTVTSAEKSHSNANTLKYSNDLYPNLKH